MAVIAVIGIIGMIGMPWAVYLQVNVYEVWRTDTAMSSGRISSGGMMRAPHEAREVSSVYVYMYGVCVCERERERERRERERKREEERERERENEDIICY